MLCAVLVQGQTTVHEQNFSSGLGNWQTVDILDPTDQWLVTAGSAQIDGTGGGNDEDWLISPSFDMDAQDSEYLLFDYHDSDAGSLIDIYYSTDYNGAGTTTAVNAAVWTELTSELVDIDASPCQSTLFQRHPAIDVSFIAGSSVYFAFKYVGNGNSAKDYRIDNVEVLSDYYAVAEAALANGVFCAGFKTVLNSLISKHTDRIDYSSSQYDVWDALLHTDDRLNDSGVNEIVWDMFTDIPSGTGEFEYDHCSDRDNGTCSGGEGICYNREHTLPRSWWGGGTALSDTQYVDLHHIVPSDKHLNTLKFNYPPGEVLVTIHDASNGFKVGDNSTYGCSSNTKYFEPIDEYKGDYARIFYYMATRYEHIIDSWESINPNGDCALSGNQYTVYEPWLLSLLSKWHFEDPVSPKEVDRNNAVYSIQGNRNPFIDHPEYVGFVWDDYLGNPCGPFPERMRVMLQGPYDTASGLMNDDLRSAALLPLTEPYTALGFNQVGSGGETINQSVLATTGNNAIVDWLLIELRDEQDSTSVVSTIVCLLQRNGDVVGLDGVTPIDIGNVGDTRYVAVRHRNHLGVMSFEAIELDGSDQLIAFSDGSVATYGSNAQKFMNGDYMMWSGNAVPDSQLMYTGGGNDRDAVLVSIGGTVPTNTSIEYAQEDCNMDGVIKYTGVNNDRDIVLVNIGGSVPTNVVVEQLP